MDVDVEDTQIQAPGGARNGQGVEKKYPEAQRAGHARNLLPLSWLGESVDLSLRDGDSMTGTLLDWCGMGVIVRCRLSKSEATRRVVAWEMLKFVDLKEGA